MKGVTCLGSMFCRQTKDAIVDDAIIVQKPNEGDTPSIMGETKYWPEGDIKATFLGLDISSGWQNEKLPTCVPNLVVVAAVGTSPPKRDSPEFSHIAIDLDVADMPVAKVSPPNWMGEAEYEGEDEDDDTMDPSIPRETPDCDTDYSMFDCASDLTFNRENATHGGYLDNENARYYENSASGSNVECQNPIVDLEMASDHVSDPGRRFTKDQSVCTTLTVIDGNRHERNMEIEKDVLSKVTRPAVVFNHQTVPLLHKSPSAGDMAVEFPIGGCVSFGGSPNSDGLYKLGAGSQVMEAQRSKPWWKVFSLSLGNKYLETNGRVLGSLSEGDIEMSPRNGYGSDVETRSGWGSSVLHGVSGVSDGEKKQCNLEALTEGRSAKSSHSSPQKFIGGSGTSRFSKSNPSSEISALPVHEGEISTAKLDLFGATHKWETVTAKTGVSRVEEWVSSVQTMAHCFDDDQIPPKADEIPDSPTAPAAAFFNQFGSESKDSVRVVPGNTRGDRPLDPDAEMAEMVARSVNTLSTVAHFSGVGLKVIPNLGMFGNLKTLNLSANNFVRVTPSFLPKSLHSLDISRNGIVVVEGLRELTRLRVLNLSFNRIVRIGNGLSSCTSLKEVYLAGNRISEVEGLHRLSKLVVLDLSFNKLSTTKSMGQIAANYKSLQAVNLLGNVVHTHLGDEQLRRFVTGICPQLVYLNKQALKSISSREALGKELKGSVRSAAKPSSRGNGHQSSSSHRRSHSGGGAGVVKSKSTGKLSGKGAVLPPLVQGEGHHRKVYQQNHSMSSKEALSKGLVPLPPTAKYKSIRG